MGCICGKKENNNSSDNFEHNSWVLPIKILNTIPLIISTTILNSIPLTIATINMTIFPYTILNIIMTMYL